MSCPSKKESPPCLVQTLVLGMAPFECEEEGSKHVDDHRSRAEKDTEHVLGRCHMIPAEDLTYPVLCDARDLASFAQMHRHAIVTTAIEADKQFQKKRNLPKKSGGPELRKEEKSSTNSSNPEHDASACLELIEKHLRVRKVQQPTEQQRRQRRRRVHAM